MWRDLWATRRSAVLAAAAVTVLLVAAAVALTIRTHTDTGAPTQTGAAPADTAQLTPGNPAPAPPTTAFGGGDDAAVSGLGGDGLPAAATGYDHAGWNAVPPVAPGVSAAYPPIAAAARTQPDLFVAAFSTQLLTRNYAGSSRAELLSWAQSEAAALSIRQVPLSAADRDKALIVSLTSTTWDGAPTTPVPSAGDWADLAALDGYTTVTGVKVSPAPDFPPAGVSFTDPLTLARLYTATVTLHTTIGSTAVTSSRSVAFQVVLGTSLVHGAVFGAASTQDYVERGSS